MPTPTGMTSTGVLVNKFLRSMKGPPKWTGVVFSNKMNKTVTVVVEHRHYEPRVGAPVKRLSKFMAHDENQECRIGDVVEIELCKKLSKRKAFRLVRVLKPNRSAKDPLMPVEQMPVSTIPERVLFPAVVREVLGAGANGTEEEKEKAQSAHRAAIRAEASAVAGGAVPGSAYAKTFASMMGGSSSSGNERAAAAGSSSSSGSGSAGAKAPVYGPALDVQGILARAAKNAQDAKAAPKS